MLQAVIFDFDGIIADTERLHYLAFERILAPRGLGVTWEDYVERCIGFDDRDVFRQRLKEAGDEPAPEELKRLIEDKARAFLCLVEEEGAPVYPGVIDLINQLAERGMVLALCSGALRSDIDGVLDVAGLADRFPVIVTAEDVARSKPDPESYRIALAETTRRVLPGEAAQGRALAIEDTPAGIISASGAGLRVLAVTNTHPAQALACADKVVKSLADVTVDELAALVAAPDPGRTGS